MASCSRPGSVMILPLLSTCRTAEPLYVHTTVKVANSLIQTARTTQTYEHHPTGLQGYIVPFRRKRLGQVPSSM
eukprot:1410090-Amphidinium_carterae.1